MLGFIGAILVGALAGFLAGRLTRGRGFGALGNIVVGIVGAMLGSAVLGLLGLTATHLVGRLIVATFGAALLVLIIGMLKRR